MERGSARATIALAWAFVCVWGAAMWLSLIALFGLIPEPFGLVAYAAVGLGCVVIGAVAIFEMRRGRASSSPLTVGEDPFSWQLTLQRAHGRTWWGGRHWHASLYAAEDWDTLCLVWSRVGRRRALIRAARALAGSAAHTVELHAPQLDESPGTRPR